MKVLQIGIFGVALVVLASCSSPGTGDARVDYRAAAKQVTALDIPPDLTAPSSDERYQVPQSEGASVATYSGFTQGGDGQSRVVSLVLPEVQGVRLERNGTQRWLVVNDKAENVWPTVKSFWQELGLVISSEDPAAGVMETDWKENRAKIPKGAIRNILGKVFDSVYSSGERDQFRTRLERSKKGASTEVYITHRGMTEVYAPDLTSSKWQARANDPELEAIMLQRLMVRFGASEAQAASAVAATGTSDTPGATISTTDPAGVASLREMSGGSVVIVMNDPFDRAWRKVGLAIEGSSLAIEDKDRDKGLYYLRPVKFERGWWDKLKFWKAGADSKRYRVQVKDEGAACVVSVMDQDGTNSSVTKQMVETIYKNINL